MDAISKIHQIAEVIDKTDKLKLWNGFEGRLGCSIFYYTLFLQSGEMKYKNRALRLLDIEVQYYNSMNGHFCTFWSGFSGLSWMIKYLSRTGLIKNDYGIYSFDSYLFNVAYYVMEKKKDYLNGSLGVFYSLITINNEELRRKYEVQLVHILCSSKINKGKKKMGWIQDDLYPNQFNLSLSHGMSSIVVLLSKIYRDGVEKEKCTELIEGAVNFILDQKLPNGGFISVFGNYALESMEQLHSSRLAWCYGDLGIAVALLRASQALNRKEWENEAKTLLQHASNRRNIMENGVMDACFCHGASGIAHVFNRMWKETGLPECKDATEYWINQTLKMARFEDGLAGYKTWQGSKLGFQSRYGLLEGIAGIGLALLSYISDDIPIWDECLLLN